MICVDASVAAKWLFAEEYTTQADDLLRVTLGRQEQIVAPPLLWSEIANILRQRMRRTGLQLAEARALMAQFLRVPIALQAPDALYDRILVLADQYNLPAVYDAHYLALAEFSSATFWTADRRLLQAVEGRLPFVRWIADFV
jgi:predicted nucleic acid-binding protein